MTTPSAGRPTLVSAPNFRDLGGTPAADGRRVAFGRVFRSEAVLTPTDEDERILRAHRVRLVCDLRGDHERALAPNAWWCTQTVELLALDSTAGMQNSGAHWDRLRADPTEAGARAMMRLVYAMMPAAIGVHVERMFGAITRGGVPLLIHCTAGKDRTGAFAALLLHALGVPREAIYADYLESARWPNPSVARATAEIMEAGLGTPISDAALQAICGVDAMYLDTFFTRIEDDYGSIDQYLESAAGLHAGRRAHVRNILLER
jgi:protein-tyrosine phosphatase